MRHWLCRLLGHHYHESSSLGIWLCTRCGMTTSHFDQRREAA